MNRIRLLFLILLLLPQACSDKKRGKTVPIKIGDREIGIELIRSREALKEFMGWSSYSEESAYLVAYPEPRYHFYVTHDRPRDIVFTDADGRVLETAELLKGHENGVTSSKEATHAFVFLHGMIDKLGVKAGDKIDLPAELRENLPSLLVTLKAKGSTVQAEVAVSQHEQQHGLMYRKHMSKNDGMLFLYNKAEDQSFWMRNTLLDLDIAFFRSDKSLINVVEIRKYDDPESDEGPRAKSREPAKYVLEMNYGWFRSKGLTTKDGSPSGKVYLEIPSDAGR